jgi:hypothetical protein
MHGIRLRRPTGELVTTAFCVEPDVKQALRERAKVAERTLSAEVAADRARVPRSR